MFIKSYVAHHIKSMKTVEVFLLESYVCKIIVNYVNNFWKVDTNLLYKAEKLSVCLSVCLSAFLAR